MFSYAAQFDQDISHWNVERVGSFTAMFLEARSFSKDVSSWNPASATSMQYMFAFPSTVTTFDHTLCWAETSSSSSYSYSYSAITALMFFGGGASTNTACEKCLAGRYRTSPVACADCSAGKYAPIPAGSGAVTCQSCPSGLFSFVASRNCSFTSCPAGSYNTDGQACQACEAGKYSSAEGSGSCTVCASGTYASQSGMTECSFCAAGKYLSDNGQLASLHDSIESCLACDAGKHSPVEGSDSCDLCAVGYSASEEGSASCAKCAAGKYQASEGQVTCFACDGGKFSRKASSACSSCPGNTDSLSGSGFCHLCKPGYILDDRPWKDGSPRAVDEHNASCWPCNEDTLHANAWIDGDTSKQAISCTVHMSDGGGSIRDYGAVLSSLNVKRGYWRPTQYTFKDTIDDGLRACPMGAAACGGGTVFDNGGKGYCNVGYHGPLCALCEDRFTYDSTSNACVACEDVAVGISASPAIIVLLSLLTVGFIVLVRRSLLPRGSALVKTCTSVVQSVAEGADIEEALENEMEGGGAWKEKMVQLKKSLSVKFKILLSFLQIVTSMGFNLSGISFPSNYSRFSASLEIVSFNFFVFIPFSCLSSTPTNYYTELVFTTVGVLLLFLFLAGLYVKTKEAGYLSAALGLLFFMLPSCSSVVLRTFACRTFQDISTSYMEIDYSITCTEDGETRPRRQFWIFYAAVNVLLYPIGIPCFFATLLHVHRYDLCPEMEKKGGLRYVIFRQEGWGSNGHHSIPQETKDQTAHLVFLTENYEPHVYWFEVFECLRRLMLSSMLVLIQPGSAAQIVIAIFICLISIKVYSYYQPFVEEGDDHLAEAAQWQTFCVVSSAKERATCAIHAYILFPFGLPPAAPNTYIRPCEREIKFYFPNSSLRV